jgi:hypothetical protein
MDLHFHGIARPLLDAPAVSDEPDPVFPTRRPNPKEAGGKRDLFSHSK